MSRSGGVVRVSIPAQAGSSQLLRNQVFHQLGLDHLVDDEQLVFKLRDTNGALLPLSSHLESNDSSWYIYHRIIPFVMYDM